ncbi:MAG: hypothetical protein JJE18_08715 [Eubacteriaceae bacterium]|nr:hypothetical protein [Eubacteriaceae bacterium]
MKPIIIGQSWDDPSTIIVQVDQIDEIQIVKTLNLTMDTVSTELTLSEVSRYMPWDEYTGSAQLEEILETHNLKKYF